MPKLTILTIATIFVNSCFSLTSQAQEVSGRTCHVADPTGTPLNARLQPNGKIVNRIKNGKTVYAQSISADAEGKPWVLVASKNQGKYKILGYVLKQFVICD
jgi:hypothetical protein